jgi:hypothetical protein
MRQLKAALFSVYDIVSDCFDYYAACSGGSGSQMRLNAFSDFLDDCDIPERESKGMTAAPCSQMALDRMFTTANFKDDKGSALSKLNDSNALMRFEFLEVVVRVAVAKWLCGGGERPPLPPLGPEGSTAGAGGAEGAEGAEGAGPAVFPEERGAHGVPRTRSVSEALGMLCALNIQPHLRGAAVHDRTHFRRARLYTQEVADLTLTLTPTLTLTLTPTPTLTLSRRWAEGCAAGPCPRPRPHLTLRSPNLVLALALALLQVDNVLRSFSWQLPEPGNPVPPNAHWLEQTEGYQAEAEPGGGADGPVAAYNPVERKLHSTPDFVVLNILKEVFCLHSCERAVPRRAAARMGAFYPAVPCRYPERFAMDIHQWCGLLQDAQLFDADFTKREARHCFTWSKMKVSAEGGSVLLWTHMLFTDFLEGLARVAELMDLPSDVEVIASGCRGVVEFRQQQGMLTAQLHRKAKAKAAGDGEGEGEGEQGLDGVEGDEVPGGHEVRASAAQPARPASALFCWAGAVPMVLVMQWRCLRVTRCLPCSLDRAVAVLHHWSANC